MDFWTNLGISVVLQILANHREVKRVYPALAKIFAKIEAFRRMDPALDAEITHQLAKEGLS